MGIDWDSNSILQRLPNPTIQKRLNLGLLHPGKSTQGSQQLSEMSRAKSIYVR